MKAQLSQLFDRRTMLKAKPVRLGARRYARECSIEQANAVSKSSIRQSVGRSGRWLFFQGIADSGGVMSRTAAPPRKHRKGLARNTNKLAESNRPDVAASHEFVDSASTDREPHRRLFDC